MFEAVSETYFKMLVFDATGNENNEDYGTEENHTAIRLTGEGEYYEIKDFYVYGFYDGVFLGGNGELWMFEGDIENCKLRGFYFGDPYVPGPEEEYAGGSVKISDVDFTNNRVGICFTEGYNASVSIMNCGFYPGDATYASPTLTNIGINRLPDFQDIKSIFISNNTWDNTGVFISEDAFDFSRPDGRDANVLIVNNAGIADFSPSIFINVLDNATTQTLGPQNAWDDLNYVPDELIPEKFWFDDRDLVYLSDYSYDLIFQVSGTVFSTSTRVFQFGLWKSIDGGSTFSGPYAISTTRTSNQAPYGKFTFFGRAPNVQKGDLFVIAVRCTSTNNAEFTLTDLQGLFTSR
jgi:hypothetical protein